MYRERALEFVWKFADDRNRQLIERLACRRLYKRVFELKLGDLGQDPDYSAFVNDLVPEKRIGLSEKMEATFMNQILRKMQSSEKGSTPLTASSTAAAA